MRLPTIQEIRLAKARKSLAYFTTYTKPDYLMGWVHKEICDMLDEFLEAVKEKKSPRLIITLPPLGRARVSWFRAVSLPTPSGVSPIFR